MGKDKLKRFRENLGFTNLIQPNLVFPLVDHELKGRWNEKYFGNDNPIVIELGCGRGEYTINLATKFPEKNFIGIDYKGARLWRGAKTAFESGMRNVAFLRIQIQNIASFFANEEVAELWITFPDPHLLKSGERKRLTSPRFIEMYRSMMKKDGVVNLKTDSKDFYEYTSDVINSKNIRPILAIDDLYPKYESDEILSIKTTYEKTWLQAGSKICYLKFPIGNEK